MVSQEGHLAACARRPGGASLSVTPCRNSGPKKNKTGHRGSALFSLFSGQQSPYMHPSAELYIPVSDVHPSLAMQITLFSLLRGIKNLEKTKKNQKKKQNDRTHVPASKTSKNKKKQKKNKMTGPMSQYPKPRKNKKTKRQNLCPSIWHGVSTFGFFVFFGFSR